MSLSETHIAELAVAFLNICRTSCHKSLPALNLGVSTFHGHATLYTVNLARSYKHLSYSRGSVLSICTTAAICPAEWFVGSVCIVSTAVHHSLSMPACSINVLSTIHVYSHLSC